MLYQNKYRTESSRLPEWNYAENGVYFVTICTHGRQELFGHIVDGEMILSEIGAIVEREWKASFEIREELHCDCYMIMPDHVHGVIELSKPDQKNDHPGKLPVEMHGRASLRDTLPRYGTDTGEDADGLAPFKETHGPKNDHPGKLPVETHGRASLQGSSPRMGIAYRAPKSISSFVAGFKSSVTKRINQFRKTPGEKIWQPRFHDRVIRTEEELEKIREYVVYNAVIWQQRRDSDLDCPVFPD